MDESHNSARNAPLSPGVLDVPLHGYVSATPTPYLGPVTDAAYIAGKYRGTMQTENKHVHSTVVQ